MKKIFKLQGIFMLCILVFNKKKVYQQNVTKFYRIQTFPNLKICWSVSFATKRKKKFKVTFLYCYPHKVTMVKIIETARLISYHKKVL